jgi:polyribonucleotide nucleotidyltransferase
VKLLGFDDRGKVKLSMKVVDQATGEDLDPNNETQDAGGGGGRRRRGGGDRDD